MSAALTISAVSSGADTLTVTAHGQATGAGPAAVFVGSGGVIPGGLAPVTDYWLVVVDANTVKLADSSAHALANVTLDITSTGTLPLSLLIGIPYRRATTYVAGISQIKSDDLNTFEDSLTALWNLLTGQAQALFNGVTLAGGLTLALNQNVTLAGNGTVFLGATGDLKHGTRTIGIPIQLPVANGGNAPNVAITTAYIVPIALLAGNRILAVRAVIKDSATGPTKLHVSLGSAVASAGGGAYTNVASSADSAGTAAVQTLSLAGLTTVVAAGSIYAAMIIYSTGVATCQVYGVEVDYDRP